MTRINIAMTILALACCAMAQESAKPAAKKTVGSNASYIAKALSAAPKAIAKNAGVMQADKDGKMQTLRESKNGFTCMVALGSPMCADENSMAFFGAWMNHQDPPQDKAGVTYMLRGDNGASNTDPYAKGKTADNHWIATGPHIMLVGPAAKSMGLPDSPDADPTKPYLMWANTPYAHAMIPVGGASMSTAASAAKSGMDDMKDMKH